MCLSKSENCKISLKEILLEKDREFIALEHNTGDVSAKRRLETLENGQHPYCVVVTCSDSRVPPEHIFNAGIGELFVIRTAGNVIGEYELGSIEYGVEHLGAEMVLVLGHTHCGAVDAALNGGAHGNIGRIIDEIAANIPSICGAREAEKINAIHSVDRILESEIIKELVEEGKLIVRAAIYDIETGIVDFLDD